MNSNKITAVGGIILLVIISLFLVIDIFASGGNQLSQTFRWALVASGILGFISPRAGLLLFLVLQYYADLLKRLLILGEGLSIQDIMISLGLGPVMVVAACCMCTIQCITGKVPFGKRMDILFFICCVLVSLIGLAQSWGQEVSEMGQFLMGTSMVGMTAFACYCIFRQEGDLRLLLRIMLFAGAPMAIYTLWQAAFGIAAWEERYILTGLSKVLYTFYLLDGPDGMRPFSTLNTHTAVGGTCGVLFVISAVILSNFKRRKGSLSPTTLIYWILAILYLAACLASRNRTTFFIPVFYLIAVFAFRSGLRTAIFYGLAVSCVAVFIASSNYINDNILYWAEKLSGTSAGDKFGSIGTYQARLGGLMALTEAKYWTPMGVTEELRPYTHDLFSESIFRFGYIPVGFALFLIALVTIWWHRSCLAITDRDERLLAIRLTAVMFGLTVCGLAYGNLIFVAPVNGILGALFAICMITIRRNATASSPATSLSTSQVPKDNSLPEMRY